MELFPKPNDTMPCWETFIDTVQPSIAAHVKKMLEIKQLLLGNLAKLRELAKPNINSKKDFEDASNTIEYILNNYNEFIEPKDQAFFGSYSTL